MHYIVYIRFCKRIGKNKNYLYRNTKKIFWEHRPEHIHRQVQHYFWLSSISSFTLYWSLWNIWMPLKLCLHSFLYNFFFALFCLQTIIPLNFRSENRKSTTSLYRKFRCCWQTNCIRQIAPEWMCSGSYIKQHTKILA